MSDTAQIMPDRDHASGEAQKDAMVAWMQAIAPYGIFTTDAALCLRSWNQWLVAHSGLAPEEVIGRSLVEVFPELSTRGLQQHFQRALAGEISLLSTALHKFLLPLRTTVRGGNSTQMLQTVRIAPLVLEDRVIGTIATIEDVTQREAQTFTLRRQQEHDRLLSSALALLLASDHPLQVAAELFPQIAAPLKLEVYFSYLLAPGGEELHLHAAGGVTPELRKSMAVVKVGEGACGVTALSRKPVIIPRLQDSKAPDAVQLQKMGLRVYAGFPLIIGDRLLGTLSFGSYERDTVPRDEVEFLATVAQYLAIAIDRALRENALRQAQHSLSEHASRLETKIAERTARLHETIIQLESFSYTVAHDLRAPIRSLKGYSEILLTDYAAEIPEEARALLHRLSRASHRLDALTRDLLAFSKIARQDVQLSPIDLGELVHDLVSATPALQAAVTIEDPLGVVRGQRTLLEQCLSNLFDNALKFATPGVPPRIRVRAGTGTHSPIPHGPSATAAFSPSIVQRDDGIEAPGGPPVPAAGTPPPPRRIWVEDNGIGIAPHAHVKIFGIFERVSGLEHVEGTGIGLAIVARAMQQMGGDCGVESTLGAGSRFWIELPAA